MISLNKVNGGGGAEGFDGMGAAAGVTEEIGYGFAFGEDISCWAAAVNTLNAF
jgi:hypothetical protein